MMLTVLSGFVGRYFLSYSSKELREKQDMLNLMATQYNQIVGEIGREPNGEVAYVASHNVVRRALNSFIGMETSLVGENAPLSIRAVRLAESIADIEYSIKTHELLKRRTAHWLIAHIVTSCAFYILLIIHVWSGIYFGIRWFN